MIKIKRFQKKHYPFLQQWFKQWGWSDWPIDAISPYSYILYHNKQPVFFGSFYKAKGCSFGCLGFFISDRNVDKLVKVQYFDLLIEHIFKECERIGLEYLNYYTASDPMIRRLSEKHGMKITDNKDATILLKSITGKNLDFFDE